MTDAAAAEALATRKRAVLWVFDQLLREGVVPYTPAIEAEGVDAVVRCLNGRYRDLRILVSPDEHRPGYFVSPGLEPRDGLFVVCVGLIVSPQQCWVVPSSEFARYADESGSLDLDAAGPDGRKLRVVLSMYRNALRLIGDSARRPFVR